jgi:signal transduction histidine kinase
MLLTLILLLLLAMLLVNAVLIMLWKRDAVQREAGHDQLLLSHIQYRIATESTSPQQTLHLISFAEIYPEESLGQIIFFFSGAADSGEDWSPLLRASIHEALEGKQVSHSSFSLAAFLLQGQPSFLITARPLLWQGQQVGVVALQRSLQGLAQSLWQGQKIILLYILINLMLLGLLSFFRLSKLMVRPIERLAQLAEQHSSQQTVWFVAENSGSAFDRLAHSLNGMLAKIEADRQTLQETVAQLEAANQALQRRQQEMIRAEKMASVGRMAAGLAHEIGNPLGVIQGYLGLLARSQQTETHQDYIRRAEQEAQRVNALIRQLLDYARAPKGKPASFSLHQLVQEVVEMLQVQPAFRHIRCSVQAEAPSDRISADPDQLRQVLINCLLNSADAIMVSPRAGEGRIHLTTTLLAGDTLNLSIEDNGSGMNKECLAVVFDPFFTSKEPGRGTGLGLSVSRALVEQAGGTIHIESSLGQGSTVVLSLPLENPRGKV